MSTPAFVWMWVFFLVTLLGASLAGNFVVVGWYWSIPVLFFALAILLTLDAASKET